DRLGGESSPSWRSLREQIDEPGSESAYFSSADMERSSLARHPWSMGGGGAASLKELLDARGVKLSTLIEPPIGRAVRVGHEDVYIFDDVRVRHAASERRLLRPFLIGEGARDWSAHANDSIWYPYGPDLPSDAELRPLWPWRTLLGSRAT